MVFRVVIKKDLCTWVFKHSLSIVSKTFGTFVFVFVCSTV